MEKNIFPFTLIQEEYYWLKKQTNPSNPKLTNQFAEKKLIERHGPFIFFFLLAWSVIQHVVDPLSPQLIVYTRKSAFLAGMDNLAKWNYQVWFAARVYSQTSLFNHFFVTSRLTLELAQITMLLLCIHSPALWEQNEGSRIHTEILQ